MAAAEATTGASTMIPDASAGTGTKLSGGMVGPTTLGFLAFGLMSILFGLSQLPGPYSTGFNVQVSLGIWATGSIVSLTMLMLGGIVLILIGGIAFLKSGHPFWSSAFFGFGAFWLIWSSVASSGNNHLLYGYGVAGFALLWVLFSLTYLISSMKHGWMTFIFFLVVTIAYILLVVEAWQWGAKPTTPISGFELGAIGGFWILAGIIGWYSGTARLAEYTYGKKVLPG